jgi:hypothetical protein
MLCDAVGCRTRIVVAVSDRLLLKSRRRLEVLDRVQLKNRRRSPIYYVCLSVALCRDSVHVPLRRTISLEVFFFTARLQCSVFQFSPKLGRIGVVIDFLHSSNCVSRIQNHVLSACCFPVQMNFYPVFLKEMNSYLRSFLTFVKTMKSIIATCVTEKILFGLLNVC